MVAVLAVPAAAVSGGERRDEIAEEVERLAEQVDEAAAQEADALAELELTRRAKGELDVAVVGLDRRLTAARADLAASEGALADAEAERRRAGRRLEAARSRVVGSEQVLRGQAVSRFMRYGVETSTLDVFLQVRDLRALHDAAAFVGAVAAFQAEVVRQHRELEGDTAELERRAEQARYQAERRREEVAGHSRELEALRSDQAAALAAVEVEESREEQLVSSVRATRDDYEARIAALEAESQSITELLRQRQAAQAAQAAPEAQRRAADTGADQDATTTSTSAGEPDERPAGRDRAERPGATPTVPAVTPAGGSALRYPLANPVVTSGYGYRIHPIYGTRRLHAGVDLRGATGTTVLAAGDGTVIFAGARGGYGNAVIIDHGGSIATLYAHQSRLAVSAGELVRPGQAVGAVGSTGLSSGPHLHFEVRVNGTPVDPLNYL